MDVNIHIYIYLHTCIFILLYIHVYSSRFLFYLVLAIPLKLLPLHHPTMHDCSFIWWRIRVGPQVDPPKNCKKDARKTRLRILMLGLSCKCGFRVANHVQQIRHIFNEFQKTLSYGLFLHHALPNAIQMVVHYPSISLWAPGVAVPEFQKACRFGRADG